MRKLSLLALVLGFAACRGDDSTSGDDTPGNDANPGKTEYTIQEIQNDAMPACDPANPTTCVNLTIKGVVVTAIDKFGAKTGDFWVQEPEGGPYSGVQVFGAPIDAIAALEVGDIVDITNAQKSEFALTSDTSGNKLTELEPVEGGTMTVTKVMSGTPLQPTVVDALVIGQMPDFMARAAEWEKWEGVLVTVNNVQAFSDTTCITSMGNCNDNTYERFDVTGDIQVQSALAGMPSTKVKNGDCLAGVTGVMTYFFDYQILPRTTAEMVTGGSACPKENTAPQCGDGVDNDGNGFKDCNDNQCVVASATCRMDDNASIASIQSGTITVGSAVQVQNAIVTAVSFAKKDVWISTSATAAINTGIQVHFNNVVPNTVTVGKTVNVIGKTTEFNDSAMVGTGTLTEINGYDIAVQGTATATLVPVPGQMAATLNNDTTGEPFESVLVTLTNVKLTALADAQNHVGQFTQGATTFKFDDVIFRIPEGAAGHAVNTCFSSITGIWSYNVFDNVWIFYPTADGTVGGTCP